MPFRYFVPSNAVVFSPLPTEDVNEKSARNRFHKEQGLLVFKERQPQKNLKN